MRDDDIRARLREQNPWWRAAATRSDPTGWAQQDPLLRRRAQWDLGYRAGELSDVAAGPVSDLLVVLRGPRRVGKSVLLKDVVLHLCRRTDIDPLQILYLATDGMRARDLLRAVVQGRELTRAAIGQRRVWLLDEITGISEWTETLKYLRDNTEFGDDTVVCTGSSWQDEADVARDLLAGRAGTDASHRERLLLPMTFRQFVLATGRDIPLPETVAPSDLQSGTAGEAAVQAELFVDELDLAWQAYLSCGGFPRAVAEYHHDGQVSPAFFGDLAAWLHRDVDADGPADSVALLLAELSRRSTSPLNRTHCAETLGYGSRTAFQKRLDRLTRSFAGIWCHQVDNLGRRIAGSLSKYYLVDPLLAWLPATIRSGIDEPDMTCLTENAIAAAIARAVDAHDPGRWMANDSIGYLRTASGNEIDFAPVAIRTPAGSRLTTAVESKWVSANWRREARIVEGKLQAGVVATKTVVDIGHPAWAMPAPLVALLLS